MFEFHREMSLRKKQVNEILELYVLTINVFETNDCLVGSHSGEEIIDELTRGIELCKQMLYEINEVEMRMIK